MVDFIECKLKQDDSKGREEKTLSVSSVSFTGRLKITFRWVSYIATVMGNFPLGLQALLTTHRFLNDDGGDPSVGVVIADLLTLITVVSANSSMVFFVSRKYFSADYYPLAELRTACLQHANGSKVPFIVKHFLFLFLTILQSFLWSGIAKLTLDGCVALLDDIDEPWAGDLVSVFSDDAIIGLLSWCTFYLNLLVWKSVFADVYQLVTSSMRSIFCSVVSKEQQFLILEKIKKVNALLLGEIQLCLESSRDADTPVLNGLSGNMFLHTEEKQQQAGLQSRLVALGKQDIDMLRAFYISYPLPLEATFSWCKFLTPHFFATVLSGVSAAAFYNVVPLSELAWERHGISLDKTSYDISGYINFFSLAMLPLLTVYPLVINIFAVMRHGFSPDLVRSWVFYSLLFFTAFIGIGNALSNIQRSYMVDEPTGQIVISAMGSLARDLLPVYYLLKKRVISCRHSQAGDHSVSLRSLFLSFQLIGEKLTAIDFTQVSVEDMEALSTKMASQSDEKVSASSVELVARHNLFQEVAVNSAELQSDSHLQIAPT